MVVFLLFPMQLQWFGLSCVKISASASDVTVLVDPFDASTGVRLAKQAADVVIVSTDSPDYNNTEIVRAADEERPPFFIANPGEYEAKGIFVYGVDVSQEPRTVAYSINIDDVSIAHLGALNRTLTAKELDNLGQVDILLVPVGGHAVLDAKRAAEVCKQIEPRVIIPVHYQVEGFKRDLDPVGHFLKEYGVPSVEAVDKVKLMKKDLPSDDTKVVILETR